MNASLLIYIGKRNKASLARRRTVIVSVTVLFSNLSVHTVYNDFLSVIFGDFTSSIYRLTLRWEETRCALGFFLGCCPIIAPFNNMDIFPHIKNVSFISQSPDRIAFGLCFFDNRKSGSYFKLLGVPSALYDAQSVTSDTHRPSSSSMNCLK